jgi:hypothetical protein
MRSILSLECAVFVIWIAGDHSREKSAAGGDPFLARERCGRRRQNGHGPDVEQKPDGQKMLHDASTEWF